MYSLFAYAWWLECRYVSIVLLSGSIGVMSFEIITEAIFVVDYFVKCILTPESAITRVFTTIIFWGPDTIY